MLRQASPLLYPARYPSYYGMYSPWTSFYYPSVATQRNSATKAQATTTKALTNTTNTKAVLITGGGPAGSSRVSAEIYHPDRDSACVLPDLPEGRFFHTQDGSLTCGGGFNSAMRSCHRWNSVTG